MRLRTPLIWLVIPLLLLAAGCSKLENNGLFAFTSPDFYTFGMYDV